MLSYNLVILINSLRQQRMGDFACRSGFQAEMHGLRTSDHGAAQACGEEYQGTAACRRRKIRKNDKKYKKTEKMLESSRLVCYHITS